MSEFDDAEIVSDVTLAASQECVAHALLEVSCNPHRLDIIVKESGLEKTKAGVLLKEFGLFFDQLTEWDRKARCIIVTSEDQELEICQARALRLVLQRRRCEVESARKRLKEDALREGQAIDFIAKKIKSLIIPIEDYLEKQEKFAENLAAERARIESERIEKERIEAEQRRLAEESAERERIRIENEQLKKEAIAREKLRQEELAAVQKKMAEERANAEAERKAIEDKARKEKIESEIKLAEEKAKADTIRKAAEVRAAAERSEAEKKLATERAKAKAEKEAADKKAEAERKNIEAKAAAERKKIEDEARAEIAKAKSEVEQMFTCPKCGYKFSKESKF